MNKVSIIIPVYNVEKYLDKCIESVCNQSLTEIEIICVNDGSTDSCGTILKKWGKRDPRIKIITQQNAGLSAARNAGMAIATGEYISFLDSDDWISGDFIETLYTSAKNNNADIAIGGFVYYENMNNMYYGFVHEHCFDLNQEILSSPMDKLGPLQSCSSCGKIYKRSLITRHNLSFYNGKLVEDFPFTFTAIALANKVICYPFVTMFYRQHPVSIMATASKNNRAARNVLENYQRLYHEFINRHIQNKNDYIQILQNFAIRNMLPWINRIRYRRDKKQIMNEAYELIRTFTKPDPNYADFFSRITYKIANSFIMRNLFYIKYDMHKIEFWLFDILPVFKFKEQDNKIKWLLLCAFDINIYNMFKAKNEK